jgi:hypothetical protein
MREEDDRRLMRMEEQVLEAKRQFGENYERAKTTTRLSGHSWRDGRAGESRDREEQQEHAAGIQVRGIDDVYNALAPLLARAQLLILPRVLNRTVSERETKSGGVLFYVVLDVEFDLVSGD